MLLITGANGNLGSQIIKFLQEKNEAENVAGLVRSEEKGKKLKESGIQIRIGDYFDRDSLKQAFHGVKRLIFISSSNLDKRVEQQRNVIDAAKEAGVEHIFYTSIVQADKLLGPLSEDHSETEKLIKDSGINYTFFRNTFYMEFLPMFLGNALQSGTWVFPSNGRKINLALRSEMAEAIANAVSDPREHLNKVYEITSDKAYDLQEIAEMLEREANTKVSYQDITISEFKKQLNEAGLPQDAVVMTVGVATTFVNGGLDYTYNHLEELLGRKPTGLKAYIQKQI